MELSSKSESIEIHEGMQERMIAYGARVANRGQFIGSTIGFQEMDAHLYGIQPGELAVLSAPPKVGKSYWLVKAALEDWRRGRNVTLFTLENSVQMTQDRIGCLAMGINSRAWQRGEADPEDVERMRIWTEEVLPQHPQQMWVLKPPFGQRSVEHMVREAQLRDSQTLLIDQLSFIELPSPRKSRTERIGEALHLLKVMISDERDLLSCILAAQINRDGIQAARKVGHLLLEHLADSAEIERTADHIIGLWQSGDARIARQMLAQLLGSRREDLTNWMLDWDVGIGRLDVRYEQRELEAA